MISAELGKALESFVEQLVNAGRYGSKSKVLREGVRLLQDREAQLAALDAVIERRIADSDAGKGRPADEVFDRLVARYRAGEPSFEDLVARRVAATCATSHRSPRGRWAIARSDSPNEGMRRSLF